LLNTPVANAPSASKVLSTNDFFGDLESSTTWSTPSD
jgi:hypothetical protein